MKSMRNRNSYWTEKKKLSANRAERRRQSRQKCSPTERENSLWVVQIENQLFGKKFLFVLFYFIDFSRITSFICAYLDITVLFSNSDFHPQVRFQTWISVTLSKEQEKDSKFFGQNVWAFSLFAGNVAHRFTNRPIWLPLFLLRLPSLTNRLPFSAPFFASFL